MVKPKPSIMANAGLTDYAQLTSLTLKGLCASFLWFFLLNICYFLGSVKSYHSAVHLRNGIRRTHFPNSTLKIIYSGYSGN